MIDPGRLTSPAASFTAAPSPSEAGGDSTTRSPADRPLRTWRSGPTLRPSVTERRCTLSSAKTKTMPALPSTRTAAAGTSTPAAPAGGAPGADGALRNDTRTPMSGTMRRSFCRSATRTFTVALLRSAEGMMAMTSPGIFQSG